MKKFACLWLLLIYSLFFGGLPKADACGPFTVDPVFSLTKHADYPLREYINGKAGIVPETFGRMSLFVFYRRLNNLPLTANEQKQIETALTNRIENYRPDGDNSNATAAVDAQPDYFQKWKDARAKILSDETKIETEKLVPNDYSSYSNCLADAFNNAANTLEDRIAKYGKEENVKEWVNGQDTVFSNCGEAKKIPESLNENFPEWLRQDREYQIAAALFYTGDNQGARTKFEQIAADSNSPWSKTARFVIARTYIRQASFIDTSDSDYESANNSNTTNSNSPFISDANVSVSNSLNGNAGFGSANSAANSSIVKNKTPLSERKKEKSELLQKAASQLQSISSDASMSEFRQSAQRLLGLTMFRLNPQQRQPELAKILSAPNENQNIRNDLIDYIWLLDAVENKAHETGEKIDIEQAEKENRKYDYEYRLKLRDVPANRRQEDLSDWLFTYQSQDGFQHAFEKWKATGNLAWFVATLIQTEKDTAQISEILSEAKKIQSSSPAFATVRFNQIRLLLETGKLAEASEKLAETFSNNLKEFPVSTQNKFLAQRLSTAQNLNEFLQFAQRKPSLFVWSYDPTQEGDDLKDDAELGVWKNRPMFDEDAVAFMNEKMPLSTLRQAALNSQLPEHLKKFLVVAVWTRAFILGNQTIEHEFAPLVERYAKDFSPEFSKYVNSSNATDREAAALITILSYPVIEPFVPIGYGRETSKPASIDSIRGNWWCNPNETGEDGNHYDRYDFQYPEVYPTFLTAAEVNSAACEHQQILASGNSATFLARRAVGFANQNPNHAQTPEILHLAVRSTRYGCTDKETLKFSKEAFQILHKRYPQSVWTQKTPYWFG
ncbi:MAG: hypothetical protein M3033_16920 [Acidobacteriota bacterium]|nr:hypothetical protein [Acidobacteriota bacterium]